MYGHDPRRHPFLPATPMERHGKILCAFFALLLLTSGWSAEASPRPTPAEAVLAKFAAVNRHDVGAIVAAYDSSARLSASDFCADRIGHADVERTYRAIFALVPEIQAEVKETLVQGDRVAVRVILHSRRPGRSFDLPLMNFFTVRNGLIVRDQGIFDNGGRACQP